MMQMLKEYLCLLMDMKIRQDRVAPSQTPVNEFSL